MACSRRFVAVLALLCIASVAYAVPSAWRNLAVGIDTSSPIRLQAGTPLQLEGTAQIAMVFANGRIEFRNGARVLGYLATDASANGARLN